MSLQLSRPLALAFLGLSALGALMPGTALAASSRAPSPGYSHASVMQLPAAQSVAGRPSREVFGFALASSLSDPTVGYPSWNFSLLSTVAFFGLHVNDDGTFASDAGMTVWHSSQLTSLLTTAHSHGTKVVLTVILQDFNAGTPHMCAALSHASTTVANTIAEVKAKGVDGVNVDYEGLDGDCGTTDASWARHTMTTFVASLRSGLPAGSYLSIDTYASSAMDPLGFFDVAGLAPSVDSFFAMAYDLEYSNYKRPPLSCSNFCLGPTAPLAGYYYSDTSTANQYAAVVPASKIILGVPYYGRKACVAGTGPNQYPTGPVTADTYLDASTEYSYYTVQPGTYVAHRDANDPTGQERWDTWFSTAMNCTRQLYWDDAASLGAKYDLINQHNLRGVGIWNLNYGGGAPELWNALSAHFSLIPGQPGNLSACARNGSAAVSWTAAPSPGGPVATYQVTASPGGASITVPGNATYATVTGLTPGTAYTFTVQGINGSGAGIGASTGTVTPVASPPVAASYFNWFDKASAGMVTDNIHLLNPGASPSSGCVTVSGQAVAAWSADPGQEAYVTFPAGTIGGPVVVTVNSGPAVLASQRVHFNQSFSEIWAMGSDQAATVSYFNWFDKASYAMFADNIHFLNPGATGADVTVSLPGAAPLKVSVGPGGEGYASFPAGTIGGPVTVSSTQPVLASERVGFYHSFGEIWATTAAQAASKSYFNWFDNASYGMLSDNLHVLNPGATAASVTVSLPGASPLKFNVAPGGESYSTFPIGTIGGPVTVTSTQPVLTSQRVAFNQSFDETWSASSAQAATTSHFNWYDRASAGMSAENVHVLNPGATSADVTVSLPGVSPLKFSVLPGGERYVSWPAATIGGPVTVTATQPVLASERVDYYLSFREIWSS